MHGLSNPTDSAAGRSGLKSPLTSYLWLVAHVDSTCLVLDSPQGLTLVFSREHTLGCARSDPGLAPGVHGPEDRHELLARADAQLAVDVREVILDRLDAHHKLVGHLAIGPSRRHEPGNRHLLRGEAPARVTRLR